MMFSLSARDHNNIYNSILFFIVPTIVELQRRTISEQKKKIGYFKTKYSHTLRIDYENYCSIYLLRNLPTIHQND